MMLARGTHGARKHDLSTHQAWCAKAAAAKMAVLTQTLQAYHKAGPVLPWLAAVQQCFQTIGDLTRQHRNGFLLYASRHYFL